MSPRFSKAFAFVLVLICTGSLRASSTLSPDEWVEIAPFAPASSEMFCANHALDSEWALSMVDDQPRVTRYSPSKKDSLPFPLPRKMPFAGTRTVLPVTNGFLVGFDAGEFGGGLWWFSSDGKDRYVISNDNVKSIASLNGSLIAVSGLAHLSISRGTVLELHQVGSKWTLLRSIELNAAPCATVRSDDSALIIVTTQGISIYNQGTVRQVLSSDYSLLYPNSVVVEKNGTILIGMRYAIAKILQKAGVYTESWLVKRGCESLKEAGKYRCACVSKEQ